MKIAIVLVNFNGLSDTIECLESISKIDDCQVTTIVVDNASTNNEADAIAERFDWVTVISSPENTGWSGGNNIGIRQALTGSVEPPLTCRLAQNHSHQPSDVVLLLNNDTVVDPTLVERLQYAFAQGFDIVGPVINEYHDREVVQTEGVRFNPLSSAEFFQPIRLDQSDQDTISPVDIVNGCAVAIARRVFEKIGLIDERFFLIGEESDFCLRAQAAGFKSGVLHQSLVFHKHSVSFQRAGQPLQRYYGSRNLWLLLNRHSGVLGRPGVWASRRAYLRHIYHMYCHERELGNRHGATAVAIGVADAFLGRLGHQPIRPSYLSRGLEILATAAWRIRGGRVQQTLQNGMVVSRP